MCRGRMGGLKSNEELFEKTRPARWTVYFDADRDGDPIYLCAVRQ
jgi:hypothetical protein